MHGVPPDLPLSGFIGTQCLCIGLGQFQIDFQFSSYGSISAEARWELRGPNGEVVDSDCEHAKRDCYRVHQIIGAPVIRYTIDPPHSFTLFFESGHSLTIYDESDRYESFSVNLLGKGSVFI